MRNLALVLAAAGTIGLAATATPVNAGFIAGVRAPLVASNTIDARCWHRRWSSRWVCQRGWHRRWRSRHWR